MYVKRQLTDAETERSFSRQAYGHEFWLENLVRDGNMIMLDGLYGHKLLPDKPMPTDYANPVLYDDNGRADNPEREIIRKPTGWRFTFEDKGADVYTLYIDSNSVWITNKEGWHRGSKRDYSDTNFSSAYCSVAKMIISRDGVNPGSVIHSALEIMPEKATLKVGKTETLKVLYEEKPLKGTRCMVYNRKWQDIKQMKSDDNGELKIDVDEPGLYIIVAKHTDTTKAVSEEFDETSFTIALTINAE